MIIELRTYKTTAGNRAAFLDIFRSKSMPAHRALGIAISEPLLSIEDPDTFFFMRGFPDLASREPLKAKFYESTLWKEELEPVLMPMLASYSVVLVEGRDELLSHGDAH